MTAILSFPRSGNHFVRFIVEYISARPTLGCKGSRIDTPIFKKKFYNKKLLSHIDLQAKPIGVKFHDGPSDSYGNLILILRNPRECIMCHDGYANSKSMNRYVAILQYFHEFQDRKLLIKYEKLLHSPEVVAQELFGFLELNGRQYLDEFLARTTEIVGDSKQCNSRLPAYKNRSGTNLRYYSEKMSDETDKKFREWISNIPDRLARYLK